MATQNKRQKPQDREHPDTLGQSAEETIGPPRDAHQGAKSKDVPLSPSSTTAGNPRAHVGDALIPGMGSSAGDIADHDTEGREGGERTRIQDEKNRKRAS